MPFWSPFPPCRKTPQAWPIFSSTPPCAGAIATRSEIPFFMMIRRSLNTFMNAFTASDWTAYPFASQNRKDFDNLLLVYLDAVFFPNLDPLDFRSGRTPGGIFQGPMIKTSDLEYKGVVFNEMKGAMSSPERQVWQTLQSRLFPTITYHHNSGGEPAEIPNLTYEQLKEFHRSPLSPLERSVHDLWELPRLRAPGEDGRMRSRAVFNTRISTSLFRMKNVIPNRLAVIDSSYALDGEEDLAHKTHVVMGWLLGKSTDLRETVSAELPLRSACSTTVPVPLRQALETTDLGTRSHRSCAGSTQIPVKRCLSAVLRDPMPTGPKPWRHLILRRTLEDVADKGCPTTAGGSYLTPI